MKFSVGPRAVGVIVMLMCSGLFLSCGGGNISRETKNAAKLKQIIVAPANPQIPKGATVQIGATGIFDDGTQGALGGSPTWQTSQSAIATVDAEGNVTGVNEGVARISAVYQGITGGTDVNVGQPALLNITISPNQSSLPVGESEQLTAAGKFSDGTVQDLTQTATWNTSGTAIASVSPLGNVVASAVGTATINASSGSVTGSASLTVTPAAVIAVNVVPATLSISLGSSSQLRALATLSNGTTQDMTGTVAWNSTQPSVATVNVQGDVTGTGKGAAQVSAAFQGMTASTAVNVGPPALVSIAVSPNQSSLPAGESEQLTATGKFTDGSVQNLTQSATWVSSGPAIASVGPNGSAVANAAGMATITATSGSVNGSASLTVTSAAVTALNIVPTNLAISLGNSGQLQAIATLSNGTKQDMTATIAWSTAQSAVATVTQGNVTGVGQGAAQVLAAYQGMTATAAVAVGPPALLSIAVSPNPLSVPVGESEQLTATGKYSDGSVQNLTQSATWASSGSAVASVSSSGNTVAKAVGTTTVSATSGTISGSARVTVTAAAIITLNILPATQSIVVNSSRQFQAVAMLSDGTTQNVTGTAAWSSTAPNIASVSSAGLVSAMQMGSTTILAEANNVIGSASLTVVPLSLVNYFNHAGAVKSGVDGTIQLANPGLTPGDLCAMVYVFDQNQELNECCGCTISDSGLRTLSVLNDLTSNPLTGTKPRGGEIKIVPSDPTQNPQCNPGSLAPTGALAGWGTNAQGSGSAAQVTETPFEVVPLSNVEAAFLANMCSYATQLGSGKGICSCGTGD
jgi:trimeric autotransporter adhesin